MGGQFYLRVVVLLRSPDRGRFEEVGLRLADEFAAGAAVALDDARRCTRKSSAGITLHRSLLPQASDGGTCR